MVAINLPLELALGQGQSIPEMDNQAQMVVLESLKLPLRVQIWDRRMQHQPLPDSPLPSLPRVQARMDLGQVAATCLLQLVNRMVLSAPSPQ